MAGIIIRVGAVLAQRGAPVVVHVAKEAIRQAPVVIRPVGQFVRGVVKGGPKYTPIVGGQAGREATIGVFIRAGMQTRQAGAYVVKTAVIRGPVTAARVAWYAIKTPFRDAAVIYQYALYGYYAATTGMRLRGTTPGIVRAIDRFIPVSGQFLNRMGLNPTFFGQVAGAARFGVYYGIYKVVRGGVDQASELAQYVGATVENYKVLAERILLRNIGPVPVVPVANPEVVIPRPMGTAHPHPTNNVPVAPIGMAPQQIGTSPKGGVIIYTPPVRRR